MNRVDKTESYLSTLPIAHQDMMLKYRDHLHRIRYCIDENYQIIRKMIEDVGNLFENANQSMVAPSHNHRYDTDDIQIRHQDMDKVPAIFEIARMTNQEWHVKIKNKYCWSRSKWL